MQGLLIIDVQNDYFPGGRCELTGAEEALQQIHVMLRQFRAAKRPIVWIQHINDHANAAFFIPNTFGVELHKSLAPLAGESIIKKHSPNSFYQTDLMSVLGKKGIDALTVCGMMTHMCIDTTVRAAKDHDLPVTLIYDACATKDLTLMGRQIPAQLVHDSYMAGLNGMFARVIRAEQFQISPSWLHR